MPLLTQRLCLPCCDLGKCLQAQAAEDTGAHTVPQREGSCPRRAGALGQEEEAHSTGGVSALPGHHLLQDHLSSHRQESNCDPAEQPNNGGNQQLTTARTISFAKTNVQSPLLTPVRAESPE